MYHTLGITRSMYYRLEKGIASLTEKNAKKIEAAYGFGAEWILYGDESKKLYPVSQELIEYLWKNPDIRRELWEKVYKHVE